MTEVERKIKKAKAKLVIEQPFFATLVLSMLFREDDKLTIKNVFGWGPDEPTMATNGQEIIYHPRFIEEHSLEEVEGVICHEVLHVSNLHHIRLGARQKDKWNIAADYAINPFVVDCGLSLPEGGCLDDEFRNMSAETIYNKLPEMPKIQIKIMGHGSVMPLKGKGGGAPSEAEIKEHENEIKMRVEAAKNSAKMQGKLPGALQRLIGKILEPKIDWKEQLSRFLTDVVSNDYSWRFPNNRFLHAGLYLPALSLPDLGGEVVFLVDTSGSITNEELTLMASELVGILTQFTHLTLRVIYVDTKVQKEQIFESDDEPKLEAPGGGGTDFRPGFKYIKEQNIQPACIVYMTDGWCNSFPKETEHPLLWILTEENNRFNPPIGEVITSNLRNKEN